MHVVLKINSGHYKGHKVSVRAGQTLSFGRTMSSDVTLPADAMLSSRHFIIENHYPECRIRDCQSTNGTFVNSVRVTETILHEGDVIETGTTQFSVSFVSNPNSPPPSTQRPAASARLPERPPTNVVMGERFVDRMESDVESDDLRIPSKTVPILPNASRLPVAIKETIPLVDSPVLDIVNRTRFSVGTLLWENRRMEARLTVIIKATWTIADRLTLAETQFPVFETDLPYKDGKPGEVRIETDRVPFKPRADIVVVGHVHAPKARPVTQLDTKLTVGSKSKTMRVFGDRSWSFATRLQLLPKITGPEPFTSMELTYRRSFGGIDEFAAAYCPENLVGVGMIGRLAPQSIHGKPLPNFENPTDLIQSWDSRPRPVGFGFYGRGWMPRLKSAGTYDGAYREKGSTAPPDDASHLIFNGAHPDLQVDGYLRGDEDVELIHLSPQGNLRFQLPGVTPHVRLQTTASTSSQGIRNNDVVSTSDSAGWLHAVRPNLDTLVFLPDQGILYEVFRAVFAIPSLEQPDVSRIQITSSNKLNSQSD